MSNKFVNLFIEQTGIQNCNANNWSALHFASVGSHFTSYLTPNQLITSKLYCDYQFRQPDATLSSILGEFIRVNFIYLKPDGEKKPNEVQGKLITYEIMNRLLLTHIGEYKPEFVFDDEMTISYYRIGNKEFPAPSPQPSGLDSHVFDQCIDIVERNILIPSQFETASDIYQKLHRVAGRIIHKLSLINQENIIQRIENSIKSFATSSSKDDSIDSNFEFYRSLKLLEFMDLTTTSLARVFESICVVINSVSSKRKLGPTFYSSISRCIRQCIWTHYNMYPNEMRSRFTPEMKAGKDQLAEKAMQLLDLIEAHANSLKKQSEKTQFWPLIIDLMILCPKLLNDTFDDHKKLSYMGTGLNSKVILIDQILKSKSDVNGGLPCIVDMIRAASLTNKSDFDEAVLSMKGFIAESMQSVRDRIFSSDDIVKTSDGDVDYKLLIDFLVGTYRLDMSMDVTAGIFALFFQNKNAGHYQYAAVKALQVLADQGKLLPWYTPLVESKMYQFHSKHIRTLLKNYANDLYKEATMIEATSPTPKGGLKREKSFTVKKSSTSSNTTIQCSETVMTLLNIFETEPLLAIENTSRGSSLQDMCDFFQALCLLAEIPSMQTKAIDVLKGVHRIESMEAWWPQDPQLGLIEISSTVLVQIMQAIKNDEYGARSNGGEMTVTLLELLRELLTSFNNFLSKHREELSTKTMENQKRLSALKRVDDEMQMLLCSQNNSIWENTVLCLGELCKMIDILGEKETQRNVICINYALYAQLFLHYTDKLNIY